MAGPIRGMQKLTEEDVARAQGLMNAGLGPDEVRAKLIDGGMSDAIASHAMQVAAERRLAADSLEMLMQGKSPDAAKQYLMSKGVSPFVAEEVIQEQLIQVASMRGGPGVGRRVVGGFVVLLGIGLLIGNMTGLFVTFPFAGFIVIFIGLAIMGS